MSSTVVRRRPRVANQERRVRPRISSAEYIRPVASPAVATSARMRRGRSWTRTRTRRRGKRRYGRIVRPRRAPLNIPQSCIRRLSTVMRTEINPAASSAPTVQIYNLNGCYDPTGAVSSQQPLYFDQYSALYQQYCVVGYKIIIDAVSSDDTNAVVLGFTPMTTSTALNDPAYYMEQKGTTHRTMTKDIDKVVLTNKGSIKKWLRPNGGPLLNDTTYCGSPTTNPTTVLFGHLWAAALAGAATDPSTVTFVIKIEQIVKFFNPITPARS